MTPLQPTIRALLAFGLGAAAGAQLAVPPPQNDAVIVILREQPGSPRLRLLADLARAVRADSATDSDRVCAALDDHCRRSQRQLQSWVESHGGRVTHQWWIIPGAAIEVPAAERAALRARADVAGVFDDKQFAAHLAVATDPNNHNADAVHAAGFVGQGATLAVLDSGAAINVGGAPHPAFDALAAGGSSRLIAAFGSADDGDVDDRIGHGSAVAAIALGKKWMTLSPRADNGFAPGARLVSYKITQAAGSWTACSLVVNTWQQILRDRQSLGISVANYSFGGDPDPLAPCQRALDQAAYSGDILVVSSAGNDGTLPCPTLHSAANASGIVVGAVAADVGQRDPHQLTASSSSGPLPGDGARFYPDIVACGDNVVSIHPTSATGFTNNTGTSFAAPQVAGTALLLRAARPDLRAIDTKALILNHVEDITGQNPGRGRNDFGLGLLRTDLAMAGALMANTLQRGALDLGRGISAAQLPLPVTAGQRYAATVVWPRTDASHADWDNLDLFLQSPTGETVAASVSPRNLYEHIQFVPRVSGTYSLRVVGTELTTSGPLPFALAAGPNPASGRQRGVFETFGSGCAGSGGDPASGLVLPRVTAAAAGNQRTCVPFAWFKTRMQQAFAASEVGGPLTAHAMAFRRDEQQADTSGYDLTLEIALGYTGQPPGQLNPQFAQNILGAMTTVVARRSVRFAGTQGLVSGPEQLDFVVPFDQPLSIQAGNHRHLLLELRVRDHSRGSQPFSMFFDAASGPEFSRVYSSGDPDATTGVVDDFALVASLLGSSLAPAIPNLQADGLPQLGAELAVVLRNAPPLSNAILSHGFSDTSWAATALPVMLAPVGAPGCVIWNDPMLLLPAPADVTGSVEFRYTIPSDPSLTGQTYFQQFWVLDRRANPLGLTTTNGGRALVGG